MNTSKQQPEPVHAVHGAAIEPQSVRPNIAPAKPGKLLRLPSVEDRTGLKKSSIYAGGKAGTFPAPVRLSARAVAWREDEIDRWVSERIKTGGKA